MTADQARHKGQKIPLGLGRREHVAGIDTHSAEDQRKLVDQRDVQIALRVLDNLCRLGHLDRGCAVDSGGDHGAVRFGDDVQGARILTGDDLADRLETMVLVAGVEALRREADGEVHPCSETRSFFEDRHTVLLRRAGIDGGFVDDDIARAQRRADSARGGKQHREVRHARVVDRRRDGNNEEISGAQIRCVICQAQVGALDVDRFDFPGAVKATLEFADSVSIDIVCDHVEPGAPEGNCDGKTHIAEPDDSETATSRHEKCCAMARGVGPPGVQPAPVGIRPVYAILQTETTSPGGKGSPQMGQKEQRIYPGRASCGG